MASDGAYFLNSRVLYRMAKQAYERTQSASSDTAPDQDDALIAVLLSAATLETFIADLALCARAGSQLSSTPSPVLALADTLDEVERSRGSVRLKYLMAKMILSRQPYDKGGKPYQDFDLLFDVRNAIIHHKPEKINKDPHAIVVALAARGLCKRPDPHTRSSWLPHVSTRAIARWACNVVRDMVASITESFPKDANKTPNPFLLMAMIGSDFRGVE